LHEEGLILVDKSDRIVGYASRERCHLGEGLLHRAFSIFIYNELGQLFIQKRSSGKLLWPLFWSNSVCSHPRKSESLEVAARRRLKEEIGMESELEFLFKFSYEARFGDVGVEREVCSVFTGKTDGQVRVDRSEIEEWTFIEPRQLDRHIQSAPEQYTPWFRMEWQRIRAVDGEDRRCPFPSLDR